MTGIRLSQLTVEQISGLPQDFNLSQNYPNPFNPTTNIEYTIPEASFVQLKVYDILGNEVATLVNEEQSAGTYKADFSGNDLASGLYIAKLQTGNYTKTIKMSLLK
ncbi:MAG: T9SS type A sorting domain-containing protein [Ignavibacteriaceae bacterium]|nr:T9SS type A sorting domain-containing protein [Ignavibacteriaceae bacterium]